MTANRLLLIESLNLLIQERTKPKNERSKASINRYTDLVFKISDEILKTPDAELTGG